MKGRFEGTLAGGTSLILEPDTFLSPTVKYVSGWDTFGLVAGLLAGSAATFLVVAAVALSGFGGFGGF